jgi:hypothetical protein
MLSLLGSTLFLPLALVYVLAVVALGVSLALRSGGVLKRGLQGEHLGKNSRVSRE